MLYAIAVLLVFQLLGEALSQLLKLPIPGPVVGMALLFITLLYPSRPSEQLRHTAQTILQHFSLLFIPAGVGVMLHARRITDEWLAISAALVISTLLTILLTALTIRALGRLFGTNDTEEPRGRS